nr:MAG TPA: holin [Caudoviricetes sp.]
MHEETQLFGKRKERGKEMSREDLIRKLTSRKFWTAVVAFVFEVMVYCGANQSQAAQVSSIIMAGATMIGYALSEGLADGGRGYALPETKVGEASAPDTTKE